MAYLKEITLGEITLNLCDANPQTDSFTANEGSLAFNKASGKVYIKWGVNDTDWNEISSNFASFASTLLDGKTTGSTLIGTTRSNGVERFYVQACQVILVGVSGFVSVPTIQIGTNSATYNNIIASTTLTGLSTATDFFSFNIFNLVLPSIAGGTGIYINITGGASATTYNILALIRGFYA